jgi:hypothetical protein
MLPTLGVAMGNYFFFYELFHWNFSLMVYSVCCKMLHIQRIVLQSFDRGLSGSPPEAATDGLMAESYYVAMQPMFSRRVC